MGWTANRALPITLAAVLLTSPNVIGALDLDEPWVQTSKVRDSDPNRNDHFGATVAIDGDTMVVGHPLEHNKTGMPFYGHDRGAVTVYERENGVWTKQETFYGPAPNSRFGSSIALDGDTFVTNAPSFEASNISQAWCPYSTAELYIYERTSRDWQQTQTLHPPGHLPHDSCLGGDGEDPGLSLDGSLLAAGAAGSHGTVLIYRHQSNAWQLEQTLTEPDQHWWQNFGEAIAVSEHADTIAVGHGSHQGEPAVHLYTKRGESWSRTSTLDACCDWVGLNLALSPDGSVLTASGSPWSAETPVHLWERTGPSWSPAAQLHPGDLNNANPLISDLELDATGQTLAVGAWLDDTTPSAAADQRSKIPVDLATLRTGTAPEELLSPFGNGAVYLFEQTEDGWHQQQKITQTDDAGTDYFGWDVALDDTAATLAVGAPGHTPPQDRVHIQPEDPSRERVLRHASSCCHGAVYTYENLDTADAGLDPGAVGGLP